LDNISKLIARRKLQDRIFNVVGIACTSVGVITLLMLLANLMIAGIGEIDWQFMTSFPSRFAARSGILSSWVGSLLVMVVTGCTVIPLGIAAGVYMEEYGRKGWIHKIIEINISNLAGVPSIIYGLMALGVFIYMFGFERSVLTGGLTLAVLILPIVIVATREALRTIPIHIREAAYALGATRWQVIRHHLLPYSLGGISTGVIIAMSRAIGETAPLITIGSLTYIAFLPEPPLMPEPPFVSFEWLNSPFSVLPIQMFNWTSRPTEDFHKIAAATGIVLIAITLSMNAVAIVVRYRARRRIKW